MTVAVAAELPGRMLNTGPQHYDPENVNAYVTPTVKACKLRNLRLNAYSSSLMKKVPNTEEEVGDKSRWRDKFAERLVIIAPDYCLNPYFVRILFFVITSTNVFRSFKS